MTRFIVKPALALLLALTLAGCVAIPVAAPLVLAHALAVAPAIGGAVGATMMHNAPLIAASSATQLAAGPALGMPALSNSGAESGGYDWN